MRYDEAPSTERSIDIDAPVDDIWTLVTDINLPARFSSEFLGADWIDTDTPGVGARFVGRNRREELEWETTSVIHVMDPGESFGWTVGEPDNPTAKWRFDLETTKSGTRLTMWAQMGPGPSGVLRAIRKMPDKEQRILELRFAEWEGNMEATLAGIKTVAETSTS